MALRLRYTMPRCIGSRCANDISPPREHKLTEPSGCRTYGRRSRGMSCRRSIIICSSLLGLTAGVAAQTYPERVVHIVNPYPPGGSVDVMARILAQKLSEDLGQQFIVENRSGGGGNTGSEAVAKSRSRRLHASIHRTGTAHGQSDALQQARLRSGKGLRAHRALCRCPDRADGASGRTGEQRCGVDCTRQEEPGKDQLRVGRQRHDQSSLRRAVQEHGKDRHRACALSRRGTGHERSHRRACRDVLRSPAVEPAADQGRQGARTGERRRAATCRPREPRDHCGARACPASMRPHGLVWWRPLRRRHRSWPSSPQRSPRRPESPDITARIHELGSEPGTVFGKDFGVFMAQETRKWADVIRASGARAD